MADPDGKGNDTAEYAYSHMPKYRDTTITIRPSIGIRIWRDTRITIYDYRNSDMAGCGYMTASIYLISFFLLSVFQMFQKALLQITIRDDHLNSHVPDFLFS